MGDVIVCERVHKRYGSRAALDGFDLAVPEGMVYGLLGPNGAGKTTAVRMLATLTRPDSGRIEVAGFDAVRDAARVRERIGLVGQNAAVDEALSGRQNLELFGKLHHLGAARARQRAAELLEWFGLADTGDKPIEQYSGGMRRRLDLAVGFLVAPAVLFLDEPTTGLDPHNRNQVWEAVRGLVAAGTTVLLTTQYLEEADQLSARIAVMNHGRVIAEGTPGGLKGRMGGDRIDVIVHDAADLAATATLLRNRLHAEPVVDPDTRRVGAPATDPVADLTDISNALRDSGIPVEDLSVRRPTLDEVFLHLTGRPAAVEVAA
ncbi:ATP-binding cassette domain-containing protein [Nocardia huaxiensis]|uniref:ATP-binding cassette domain-containing protein n=1 Tax=Nocardia huaxiensis TaxID=2755382 RepID=UPI001E37B256|nr:ATP-binding cassette domain-containing protein [Nocardia huaxiensis]UFS93306.1 ATP-binding cassette domain-containing protein [Nocardia huaxiensis]